MPIAFITGASAGIGRATAMLFAQHGYSLVLVARRKERLEELAGEVSVPLYVGALDVRNRQAVEKFVAELPEEFTKIDVLVNNAGLAQGIATADEANVDDWDTMVDTNIKGLLYVTHAILPGMKVRNRGAIVNIGSVAGHVAYKGGNVYGATKAFVWHFSRSLRTDVFGTDIQVTNIEPGLVETDFSLVRFKGDEARARKSYADTRPLFPEDIAEAVLWAVTRPANVNIDNIEIMPTDQTWNGLQVKRKE